jgi:hypothetical protein
MLCGVWLRRATLDRVRHMTEISPMVRRADSRGCIRRALCLLCVLLTSSWGVIPDSLVVCLGPGETGSCCCASVVTEQGCCSDEAAPAAETSPEEEAACCIELDVSPTPWMAASPSGARPLVLLATITPFSSAGHRAHYLHRPASCAGPAAYPVLLSAVVDLFLAFPPD